MRAVLTSFGSTGDIQPYLALAHELRAHGHEPILACSPNYRSWIEHQGFPFVPIGPDIWDAQDAFLRERGRQQGQLATPDMQRLLVPFKAGLPQMYADLAHACAGADVLIGAADLPVARIVHETSAIPFASVSIAYYGESISPFDQEVAAITNPLRAELGLAPIASPMTYDGYSPQLALFAMSPQIFKLPNPQRHHHVVGFFFLDDESWQPDEELLAFLAAGKRPVVVSFGSMVYDDPAALTRTLLAAFERIGCRAIIQNGWGSLAQGQPLPPHILSVGYVPHAWLFPRAACVLHHGGGGTAAAVFRAGVPAVYVPHVWDQFIWSRFARDAGVAGPVIPHQHLTAERLSLALAETLAKPSYRQAAAQLRTIIQAEQALQTSRRLIEQLVAS